MTLTGSTLVVISSIATYINFLFFAVWGDYGKPFWANPYLHPFVFGLNAVAVLNNVGMLLVCGVLKSVSREALKRRFSTAMSQQRPTGISVIEPHKPLSVTPLPQPQPAVGAGGCSSSSGDDDDDRYSMKTITGIGLSSSSEGDDDGRYSTKKITGIKQPAVPMSKSVVKAGGPRAAL